MSSAIAGSAADGADGAKGAPMDIDLSETVTVISSDGEKLVVSLAFAKMCETLKNTIEDISVDEIGEGIPVSNVNKKILEIVFKYCELHVGDKTPNDSNSSKKNTEISNMDKKFIEENCPELSTLFELLLAADFLNIKPLLDLGCKTVANMIKGKTPEEIRETFNIKNDFTEDEIKKVKEENAWCEEAKDGGADSS